MRELNDIEHHGQVLAEVALDIQTIKYNPRVRIQSGGYFQVNVYRKRIKHSSIEEFWKKQPDQPHPREYRSIMELMDLKLEEVDLSKNLDHTAVFSLN